MDELAVRAVDDPEAAQRRHFGALLEFVSQALGVRAADVTESAAARQTAIVDTDRELRELTRDGGTRVLSLTPHQLVSLLFELHRAGVLGDPIGVFVTPDPGYFDLSIVHLWYGTKQQPARVEINLMVDLRTKESGRP